MVAPGLPTVSRFAVKVATSTAIDAESEVLVLLDNKKCFTVPGSSALWQAEEIVSATVATGVCNIRGGIVSVIGEGNLTDTINQFRFGTGIEVPDGYQFVMINLNAYNINIADISGGGSNNINVQGATAILEPGESLPFISNAGVYYAIGREVA